MAPKLELRQSARAALADVHIEAPRLDDGRELWRIASDSEDLDLNSPYFYVVWCRDFSRTSVVARSADGVCGYIAGYARPEEPETLFVWQTAVDVAQRGRGLARHMLDHLVGSRYRFVEATVTPSNTASDRFLASFARDHGVTLTRTPLLDAGLFPVGHEPETLYRMGPLDR
ncbi:diaminobutyrate acetyltransferase [Streptomyces sp. NPDC057743]|uniref:diaminobutyrate acetyltransferase n=1 Tax=Streptomyces sp. NPDC057743 TaxID=3346236 RepID=UPI00367B9F74